MAWPQLARPLPRARPILYNPAGFHGIIPPLGTPPKDATMGQEIGKTQFTAAEFERFRQRLAQETALLGGAIRQGRCSAQGPVTGFELEAWLVDSNMEPAPANAEFLAAFANPLACPELARYNVEFNNHPKRLEGAALSELHRELLDLWHQASATAERLGLNLLAIGILPTVREAALNLGAVSASNRFRALNEQVLAARRQEPLKLEICGHEHLKSLHADVMIEAAATSFQVHLQVPLSAARAYYNAALLASAPLVAVSANSPFLFGKDLWAETRIPLFEQAVASGGYGGAAAGPLRRVGFGTGYARQGIAELFEENLQHFPVLLPILSDEPPTLYPHLRLHNGTIWRWNRPLVGFDPDGTPHVRIEHRVIPAGPSVVDMIANTAFFYGLAVGLVREGWEQAIPYPAAKDNFYQAARHGLHGLATARGGDKVRLAHWILEELLPLAESGLADVGLAADDRRTYLGIIEQRAASGQTGSDWQRRFIDRHPGDFAALTREYLHRQRTGEPVHQWPL
jgi:gamma-glutamyl:cysteine ligase YbdK (ATP-grasp superfamily)